MKKSQIDQTTQTKQINEAIAELHKRSSGDFQSLLRQVENKRRYIEFNLPQIVANISRAPILLLEWGRGTGKTTAIGNRVDAITKEMPRSTGLLIGPSYQDILTRIVPSLIQGLEMMGLYQNLHYFIGKQPPRNWRSSWGKAYQPPEKYDRYISFYNGVGIHLISHDKLNDGRGINSDWIIGDEAALLDPSKLQENTDPTLRGTNKQAFKNSRYFGSRLYASSTPLTAEGQWFIDYEEKALADPKGIHFISADCKENQANLMDGYLEKAEKDAYVEWVFKAEYLNERPTMIKGGFYPLLDPSIHCYHNYNYNHYVEVGHHIDCRGDADLVNGQPLILGVDWGAAINCLTVNQHLQSIKEYRTLKSMYVLGDLQQIQDDLFNNFHEYYQYHQPTNNTIFLWYGNDGNNETGITKYNRATLAKRQLEALGWSVRLMTRGGRNPNHDPKHVLWNIVLRENDNRYPCYRMNKGNCKELYLSMRNAKAKSGNNGEIKKDKSSERSKKIARQLATDLSDANDAPLYGMFGNIIHQQGSTLPDSKIS